MIKNFKMAKGALDPVQGPLDHRVLSNCMGHSPTKSALFAVFNKLLQFIVYSLSLNTLILLVISNGYFNLLDFAQCSQYVFIIPK